MTTLVKICGVTLADDAGRVAAAGADYIGLNFWPSSKRYLHPERAPIVAGIVRALGEAKLVGVFVDADLVEIKQILAVVQLDVIQLHGDYGTKDVVEIGAATSLPVWRALTVSRASDVDNLHVWKTEAVLLDAPSAQRGGAGVTFDHAHARHAREKFPATRIVLAGGLHPGNVGAAIERVAPWCVDVASGVESAPGVKDAAKVTAFIAAARAAARGTPPA